MRAPSHPVPLHAVRVLALCAAVCGAPVAAAPDRMDTDRPDRTESPVPVGAGRFQAEVDVARHARRDDAGARVTGTALGVVNLKAGLGERADLQVAVEPWSDERVTAGGGVARREGPGDVTTRLKIALRDPARAGRAIAVMPFVTWATGARMGDPHPAFGLIVPFEVATVAGWDVGAMAEVDARRGDGDPRHRAVAIASVTSARALVRGLGTFVELYAERPPAADGGAAITLDGGLTWDLAPDVRLDAGAYVGLTPAADDLTLFLGTSIRR